VEKHELRHLAAQGERKEGINEISEFSVAACVAETKISEIDATAFRTLLDILAIFARACARKREGGNDGK